MYCAACTALRVYTLVLSSMCILKCNVKWLEWDRHVHNVYTHVLFCTCSLIPGFQLSSAAEGSQLCTVSLWKNRQLTATSTQSTDVLNSCLCNWNGRVWQNTKLYRAGESQGRNLNVLTKLTPADTMLTVLHVHKAMPILRSHWL